MSLQRILMYVHIRFVESIKSVTKTHKVTISDSSHFFGYCRRSGKEWLKRWVYGRLWKSCNDGADVTWYGSSFQTRAAATGKA